MQDTFVNETSNFYLKFNDENLESRYSIKSIVKLNDFFQSDFQTIDQMGNYRFEIYPTKRGKFHLDKILLTTNFPFNLFQSFITFDLNQFLYIFPEKVNVEFHEYSQDKVKDESELNIDIKKYDIGENPHRIIWRKSYQDNLLSKYLTPDSTNNLIVDLIDTNYSELELSKLCSFVIKMYHDQIGLIIKTSKTNFEIHPNDVHGLKQFLIYMAEYEN